MRTHEYGQSDGSFHFLNDFPSLNLLFATLTTCSLATSIDTQNFVAICTLLGTLFTSGFVFYKYDGRPPREYAYVLFVTYGSFMLVSVLLEALT